MENTAAKVSSWFDNLDIEVYSTTSDLNEDGDVLGVGGEKIEFPLNSAQVGVLR